MKKKIGFIDYCIHEWHAEQYPAMIRASSYAGRMDVALAWEQTHLPGRMTLDDYCAKYGVARASSMEQVIDECDYLIVLSPDNGEKHEELCQLPLKSGKPVYVDKPIAPEKAAAKRIFALAEKHKTPMFSASSLRFGSGLRKFMDSAPAGRRIHTATSIGSVPYHIYAIHQYEMLVEALGAGARRIMQLGTVERPSMLIDYPDGRRGLMQQIFGHPFQMSLGFTQDGQEQSTAINSMDPMSDFFPNFIEATLRFFETQQPPAPKDQTLEIAGLIEAGGKALEKPYEWIPLP